MVDLLTDDVARDARITPNKPYNFTLKKNASDATTNVDRLTCSMVVDEPLNARDKHLCAVDQVPEANKVYKPGVWVILEYNIEFLSLFRTIKVTSNSPPTSKSASGDLWKSTLSPDDPQTADIIYLASPRAINKYESLRRLLSQPAKDLIA
ncbi:hypothetical protein QIS74_13652 [Colletotrichum tabaci]|uniref:Uncharacterized protein n=1 Tax=Colletotrichum tabaci TaxID=1209068 RepID=A0AAV9SV09_9PEZI